MNRVYDNRIFNYVYNYTDHLGNIRLSYTKDMVDNKLKIMEENHYYPFGLKHQKYYPETAVGIKAIDESTARPGYATSTPYNYKYNGQEWQDELGLNMYAMDMRQYDPAIARWVVMDPVIHHSMSPYNAFDNNPVFWADPSGADGESMSAFPDTNFEKFGATDSMGISQMQEAQSAAETLTKVGKMRKAASNANGDPKNKEPKQEKNKESEVSKADKKMGEIVKEKERKEQDNNYNFFYKEKDKWLRRGAEYINDGGATEGSIAINAHGNKTSISTPEGWMKPSELHSYLYENNNLYKSSFDNKTTINIRLNACNTGNGFAEKLSVINPYLNVRAPTTGIKGVFNTGGTWVTYNNGSMID